MKYVAKLPRQVKNALDLIFAVTIAAPLMALTAPLMALAAALMAPVFFAVLL